MKTMLAEHILYGMKLWALQLVPSLFPFMVVTQCFLWFQEHKKFKPQTYNLTQPLCKILNLSSNGVMLFILGLLCGYPAGAKMVSNQLQTEKITQKEAEYLMTICNQSSPAFILTYFISYALDKQKYSVTLLFLIYLSTFLTSLITRKFYTNSTLFKPSPITHSTDSDHFFNFLDDCILSNAFICIKIGGYIILFCALSALTIQILKPFSPFHIWCSSVLELTYGLSLLKNHSFTSDFTKQISLIVCFSFGGLCTMAQIKGMLTKTSLSLKPYLIGKCIYTIILLILYTLFQLCIQII